jgi:hypothetical protein
VRHEDIPEINNPKIRFPVLEGDKLMKEVLNGGYNVHPVPPPNSEIKERIRKRYERKRIKIEKLLNRLGISFQCLAQSKSSGASFHFSIFHLWISRDCSLFSHLSFYRINFGFYL